MAGSRPRSWKLAGDRADTVLLALTSVQLAALAAFGGSAMQRPGGYWAIPVTSALLIVVSAWRLGASSWSEHRFSFCLLLSVLAVPLLQLMPMPFEAWTRFPGRETAVETHRILGLGGNPRPVSLAPSETYQASLWLLTPAAGFMTMLALAPRGRILLVIGVVGLATLSVFAGVYQVVLGPTRTFLLYEIVNSGLPTGFFANRNHQSTLLAICILLVAGLAMLGAKRGISVSSPLSMLALGLFALFTATGIATLSRAGSIAVIAALAIALGALLYAPAAKRVGQRGAVWVVLVVGGFGLLIGMGIQPVLRRIAGAEADGRLDFWPNVAGAAEAFWPIGSGLGSFRAVIGNWLPVEGLGAAKLNEAHNEYLQLSMETGLAFPALLLGFLVWMTFRVRAAIVRRSGPADTLCIVSAVGLLVVLGHSVVDYPLRTPLIAAVFGMLSGMIEATRKSTASAEIAQRVSTR